MRLMLLIIGIVLGGYVLITAFSKRKLKKRSLLHEEFEQTILENTHSQYQNMHPDVSTTPKGENDPLLDDFGKAGAIASVDYIGDYQRDQTRELTPTYEDELMGLEDEFEEIQETADLEELPVKKRTQLSAPSQEFYAITILPKQNNIFSGNTLMGALAKNHFRYGKQKLYHRHVLDNPSQPILYSIASLVEPGFFEQEKMQDKSFPGILIYMLTPGPFDPINTFEKMLTCARQLSAILHAELCDDKRKPLTAASIQHYRDKIKSHHSLQAHFPQKENKRW